jgi:iron complex outermembrane receptor protein
LATKYKNHINEVVNMRKSRVQDFNETTKRSVSKFSPSLLSLAIAAAATPSAVFAQVDKQGNAGAGQDPAVLEEVVITGFRQSLQNAMDIKQNATSIVEAISAEDLGKLPDTSIAESLARLPGLAGERRNGRVSGLSVRGFNENYVATTMNGRELLGIGDNRGVEYDLYPAEIISGAVVYKSPNAALVNQGLGGTVDLRTRRPLDTDSVVVINGSLEQNGLSSANPDFDDQGHRLAVGVSQKFADDTMGVSLTVATMESPLQEEQFRAWGYPEIDLDGDEVADAAILGGHDTLVRSSMMERDTISGVFQYQPSDKWNLTFDALYIDFKDTQVFRGLEEGGPVWGVGNNFTVNTVDNGLVTSGEFQGFHSVIRNDGEVKDAQLKTAGFNAEYQLNDDWALELDMATGRSEREIVNIESYSGVGRANTDTQGAPAARSFVMTPEGAMYGPHSSVAMPDYSDPSVIRLAGPQAWGVGISPLVDGRANAQDGFVNLPSIDEELHTLRLSAAGQVDWSVISGVEVGINYSDRKKSKFNYGAYLIGPGFYDANGNIIEEDRPVPEEYVVGTTDLSSFGLGNMLAYDGVGLYQDGVYTEIDATRYEPGRLGDTYEVSEEVINLFGMASFEYGIASGNFGVQFISTDQSATGFDTFTGPDGTVVATPTTGGDEYTQILPSLNTNFDLADGHVLRFAIARTASRARMDEMRPNNTIGFNFDDARRASADPNFSAWSGNAGNPELRPIEADQIDLSYEWYFTDDGYVAATAFYKDLLNWHLPTSTVTDFSDYIVEGYHDQDIDELVSRLGVTSTTEEAGGGTIQGYTLQGLFPFHMVHEALDGLGIIASGTWIEKGEVEQGENTFDIPGLSSEVYQLTAYYERAGFEFRISGTKRRPYLTEFYGLSLALTETEDQGAELWDAQIGYNFSESDIDYLDGLTIRLQAQNLTEEETISADSADPRRINKYQRFGTNYLLSFNYKF